MKNFYKEYLNKDYKFDKLTFISILCLIIVVAGIFGFVYEFIFYYFNSGMKYFYYRGGNFLPWINIYATGSLLIYFFNIKNRKKPLKIFISSVLITGILEFIGGWLLYTLGDGFRCWDYNNEILNFGNIYGFVCLRSVLFFGISSLLLMYIIVPIIYYLANHMNKKIFIIIAITLCSIILLDEIYNLLIARLIDTPRASDIYKQLGFKYMEF